MCKANKLFFIVGSQRSGTTLMRMVLNSHPEITAYDEDKSYDLLKSEALPKKKNIGFKIPIWTYNIKWLKKNYPKANYIYIQRDIKSIVSSMMSLGEKTKKPWIRKHGLEDIKRTLNYISNKFIKKKFINLLHEYEATEDWISIATLCSYVKTVYFLEEYKKEKVIVIKYEDLVSQPKKNLRKILNFLKIYWSDEVLNHSRYHSGIQIGETDSERSIDKNSLLKWKKRLSFEQIQRIDSCLIEFKEIARD